jgi:lipopolysaccharide export system permease protein
LTIARLTDRYLARLIFVPLVATLTLAAMLLILEKMLRLFDFVVSEGGPVDIVWKMLANLIPQYLALGIPIGLLLGVLLAFRKLALSSELDSLRGVGLGYTQLLRVPFLYAIALMGLNLAIVGFVQPKARYAYEELRFDLRSGALGASIKVGEFTNLGRRMTLRVEKSENKGRMLHGVFARVETRDGKTLAVTADHGSFLATDDPDTIILRLMNGRLVHNAPGYQAPRVLSFRRTNCRSICLQSRISRPRPGDEEELTIPELVRYGAIETLPAKTQDAIRANFHYRMVEVVMMLLVPLLAVALAVPPKRSTSGLGIFLSIVMVVTYHKVINMPSRWARRASRSDHRLVGPFAIFAGLILWMYWTLAYRPGGQPIGALERVFSKFAKAVARVLRIGGRRRGPERSTQPAPAE